MVATGFEGDESSTFLLQRRAALQQRRGSAPSLGSPQTSLQGRYLPSEETAPEGRWTNEGFVAGKGSGSLLSLRRLPRWFRLLFWASLASSLLVFAVMAVVAPHKIPVFRRRIAQRIDVRALDIWGHFVADHPVSEQSRYAWVEMGFRANIYGELLHRHLEDDVNALDESLWTFMPGVQRVRERLGLGIRSRLGPLQLTKPSRGIITFATNSTIRETVQLIGMLREAVKTTLPIEVHHYGEEELSKGLSRALGTLPGVRVVDIEATGLFDSEMLGFETLDLRLDDARQGFALLATSFEQAVVIRPGSIPLTKPENLLADPGFRSHGTLLFRAKDIPQRDGPGRLVSWMKQQFDRHKPSPAFSNSPFWNFDTNWMLEPAFMVVDRRLPKVFTALLLNAWFHTQEVRLESWHLHFPECTSESLWLALELSGGVSHFTGPPPGAFGAFTGDWDDVQRSDLAVCPGKPLFFTTSSIAEDDTVLPAWIQATIPEMDRLLKPSQGNAWATHGRWANVAGKGQCLTSASVQKATEGMTPESLRSTVRVAQSYLSIVEPLLRVQS